MELFVIIVVLGLGYFAYRNYTKDVTIEKTEEVVAPYKMEPPTLEPVQVAEDASALAPYKVEPPPTGRVDMTSTWPFPSQAAVAADKPIKQKKPAAKKAPAKPKAVKAVPAKKPAVKKPAAKKAPKSQ